VSAIRVLVADDHRLVRAGIRSLLEQLRDVTVVGEAGDGREALELIRRLHPHVALVDVTMPSLNGIEVAGEVARAGLATRVLVLSMHAADEYVRRALRAGAAGYLLKDAGQAELETAVRAAARGDTYLSPAVSRRVVEGYVNPAAAGAASELDRLTSRHRQILQLVAEGHATKDIARRLGIGVRTVESHRAELMERLGIHDVPGLVRFAIRVGLVSPEH
jgi:DNA-binding NarL/FixJ family response regulator